MEWPSRVLVEFTARARPGLGDLPGRLGFVEDREHGAQGKRPAGSDPPKAVELEHFTVRIHAEDARRVGNQGRELRAFIGVGVFFLGIQEKTFLQLRVKLQESLEHLVA